MDKVMRFIRKIIGIPLSPVLGRGFFQYSFGVLPQRTPITVVGKYVKARKIAYQYGSTNNIVGQ